MATTLFFLLFAYLSGSILYANLFGILFEKKEMYKQSADQNPGAANAFRYGGFLCGSFTLLCDALKGFLPVALYLHTAPRNDPGMSLVLAAPVLGHIFPLFFRFHGGKGIATTFGCLLGLLPNLLPVLLLAASFVFLSVGLQISPDYYRTIAAYLFAAAGMILAGVASPIWIGFLMITALVILRLHISKEEKERIQVRLLWKH